MGNVTMEGIGFIGEIESMGRRWGAKKKRIYGILRAMGLMKSMAE